ncbi:MAG: T9SS type A sorting domain-containing protein [Bacteroidetes bacterium]|nr:T9SS type A sorting domain-containing protein [Bacteroidota bacterium]
MTRHFTHLSALAAVLMLSMSTATAQQQVDIGLFQDGNELEVRARPTENFDGLLSAVLFTIRWERATGGQLLSLKQKGEAATYIPIAKSGGVHQDGPFNYQVYAGFGFDRIDEAGTTWKAGEEYVIARIPYTGQCNFALVNDAWTNVDQNNGDYYVSLNGYDRTGIIYKSGIVAPTTDLGVGIVPNPSRGEFVLTVPTDGQSDLALEIVSNSGQVVFKDAPGRLEKTYRRDMDITRFGAGNYHLRITRNGAVETHKIIVQ